MPEGVLLPVVESPVSHDIETRNEDADADRPEVVQRLELRRYETERGHTQVEQLRRNKGGSNRVKH